MNIQAFKELDRADKLSGLRSRFELPQDVVYLDGNSLGALPSGVPERLDRLVRREWAQDLISSWNTNRWIDLPRRVGDRIASLLGAEAGQVICADSISVNLFKLLSTGLALRMGRNVILSQADNFPTDLYVSQGLQALLGRHRCESRTVPEAELINALGEDVAILMLTQVNFRDGRLHDIAEITRQAHEHGALVLWDLAHSAGVIPLELDAWGVDMAVGCGYKYLNGGPGAPAFIYVARRHHPFVDQPLAGWMGHARPFDFTADYTPADGIQRFLAGTPGILGMAALDAALDVFDGIAIEDLRRKSTALTGCFINAITEAGLPGLNLLTPRNPDQRGSQVSLSHPQGYAVAQALIDRGVIVDFRAPNIIRFGFSPLYNRFQDVGLACEALTDILLRETFKEAKYNRRQAVT